MKTFLNFTPHAITMNDGRTFESQGVARVSVETTPFNEDGVAKQKFGQVEGLPEPREDTYFIVSTIVLDRVRDTRQDVVAPATGPGQGCIRDDKGRIVSVQGFVR